MSELDALVTGAEAARLLGVSPTTVQSMVERGDLQAWKTNGGHRRIVRASIDALREARSDGGPRRPASAPALVLVVEPDAAARQRVDAALARWPGPVRLLWADDAFDALVLTERHRPDVLVTDVPDAPVDGLAWLRRIRAAREYRRTTIVVSTALDDAALRARGGLPPGVVRHERPVPLEALRGIVEACTSRRELDAIGREPRGAC